MGEAVQHPAAAGQGLDGQPVVLLIQEKAGLLPLGHVHLIADAVLHNLHHRIEGVGQEALHPLHALLEAHLGVASLVDAPDGDAVLLQKIHQQRQNGGFQPVDAQGQGLHHQHVGKLVHHQAGEEIGLPEDHPAGGGVHRVLAVLPGGQKIPVDDGPGVPGQDAHRDGGGPVKEAHPQGVAVVVLDADDAAVGGFAQNLCNLVVVNPGAAGLEGAALSPLETDGGRV